MAKQRGSMHEDFHRTVDVTTSSDRSFGLIFTTFFMLVALAPMVRGGFIRPWALGAALLVAGVAAVRPSLLGPFNRAWCRLGLLMGAVVSPVTLMLVFYAALTPLGFLMRAAGKDPLKRRFDRVATSYWIERQPPGPAPRTMQQQF